MKPRIGLIGTFEVANYGDLLFPMITHRELASRRKDLEFSWFGPVGSASAGWPTVIGLGPYAPERVERLAEICDAVVIGGGDLIRSSDLAVAPAYDLEARDGAVWRPSAWFRAGTELAEAGIAVGWNGVGVAEPVPGLRLDGISYLSVRDQVSREHLGTREDVRVVPDIAFLMESVWTEGSIDEAHSRMVDAGSLPDRPYLVIQASRWVAPQVDLAEVAEVAAGRPVVAAQIGPSHGDRILVDLAVDGLGDQVRVFPHPCHLEELAAAIAHADAFIGTSLHGAITGLVYDTPFRLLDLDGFTKREAVLAEVGVGVDRLLRPGQSLGSPLLDEPAVWDRDGARQRLSDNFDQLADLLPCRGDARDLRWDDHPSVLHLALAHPPRPPEFSSEIEVEVTVPPGPTGITAEVVESVDRMQRLRSRLGDPGEWVAGSLGVPVPSDMEDWESLRREVERWRSSLANAEAGWEETRADNEALRAAVGSAQTGWQETVAEVERLTTELHEAFARIQQLNDALVEAERAREALEAHVISSPESWLAEVSGPPLMVMPPHIGDRDALPSTSARVGADRGGKLKFSILTPVYNPEAAHLTSCLRSAREQTYPNWEMVAFDGSDAAHVAPILGRFTELDHRFKVVAGENRGISGNTNRAASAASGDWFLLVDHDDQLAPDALESLAAALASEPEARFVYSDEDKIDDQGRRSDPFLKPDWSPDLLRHVNYITHLQALRRDLWEEVGGLRPECDGAQDYDLALRATSRAGGALHVPEILYHWRSHELSTALDVAIKPGAHRAGRKALEDFATDHAPGARVEFGTGPTSHRLRYPLSEQQVSVIIPFRDGWKLTETCLQALHRFGSALPLEILLVDNRSTDRETVEKLGQWKDRFPGLRVVSYDQPFNFQRLNNWAVEQTRGELLLFLNNDVEPIHGGWVEAMAEHAQRPEVGAVGARLFYPDGLVQHAGVVVGIGGYADHPWKGIGPKAWTPAGPSYWTRNSLAVTAACLMIDRSKFEDVGGFDERFVVGGGDVALGIALHERGLWNVYTPFARLLHHESVTRGTTVPKSDLEVSREVYAPYLEGRDPFYNPNLTLWDTSCSIADEEEMRARISSPVSSFGS